MTLSGHISGGNSLQKTGIGTLILDASNTYTGATDVTAGTLVVGASNALPTNGTLTISGGSLVQLGHSTGVETLSSLSIDSTSTLDIVNNHFYIDYGGNSDPIATIAAEVKSGYNLGGWNGPGIISTAAQSLTNGQEYGIGYADGKDGVVTGLSPGQIEVMYTLLGDANLDGIVNGIDFGILSANYGQPVTSWDQGDFNYDGIVNGIDFGDLSANYGQGVNIAAAAIVAATPAAASTPSTVTASTPAVTVVSASPTVTTITTQSTVAAPPAPKSRPDSVSKPVIAKAKPKSSTATAYAASVATILTSGSTATGQNINNGDAKFLADR